VSALDQVIAEKHSSMKWLILRIIIIIIYCHSHVLYNLHVLWWQGSYRSGNLCCQENVRKILLLKSRGKLSWIMQIADNCDFFCIFKY